MLGRRRGATESTCGVTEHLDIACDQVAHAWRHFGADYGYFPFIQPVLGLIWLLHPQTVRAFGIRRAAASP